MNPKTEEEIRRGRNLLIKTFLDIKKNYSLEKRISKDKYKEILDLWKNTLKEANYDTIKDNIDYLQIIPPHRAAGLIAGCEGFQEALEQNNEYKLEISLDLLSKECNWFEKYLEI